LLLPRQIHDAMIAQAQADSPNECCGLLAGTIGTEGETCKARVVSHFPLANSAASPKRFDAAPWDLFAAFRSMRPLGLEHLAIYHSHPTTAAVPSKTDLAEWYYETSVMCMIISLADKEPKLRAWWLSGDNFCEAAWEIVD